ncbi:MAG TPA: bifunctional 4-hydroxy-2-oxoglutarate aldolase/2-dehydro-3-deoxy-phosphogluconate aldolase [Candidatus Omnitrophota bacterium]|nr:bifunctional 4-hydroxy-2-oxoglutarate aldolase/2-dehydro-3-deoxy-phosphogluconate aldolase [Candidatus Omnitrophota bacterium]
MILGIIRGATKENIVDVIEASIAGGITNIEITLNTPGALEQIALASKEFKIGAGTVLNVKEAEAAAKAGASFIVSPIADPDTIKFCNKNELPVYPGALTPAEVYRAWELGATMVKVFPVKSVGGPAYIKELKGPFNGIKLLACGGVNKDNIKEYFAAGADAVAVGASIFSKELMDGKKFLEIEQMVRGLIAANG